MSSNVLPRITCFLCQIAARVGFGSLASILACPSHVRLDLISDMVRVAATTEADISWA